MRIKNFIYHAFLKVKVTNQYLYFEKDNNKKIKLIIKINIKLKAF